MIWIGRKDDLDRSRTTITFANNLILIQLFRAFKSLVMPPRHAKITSMTMKAAGASATVAQGSLTGLPHL